MGCFYKWVKNFAPLDFRDCPVITRSRLLPEALDIQLKCHIDQQDRADTDVLHLVESPKVLFHMTQKIVEALVLPLIQRPGIF